MHIQKTAGTSIVAMASKAYGKADVSSHGDFLKSQLAELDKRRFVSGHFGFAVVAALRPQRYAFTFLREPRERILSQYYYMSGRPREMWPTDKLARELELDALLDLAIAGDPRIRTHFYNQQSFQLAHGWTCPGMEVTISPNEDAFFTAAVANMGMFDYVGLVDNFDADIHLIGRELGFQDQMVEKQNVGRIRTSVSELPAATRARLDALTEIDRESMTWPSVYAPTGWLKIERDTHDHRPEFCLAAFPENGRYCHRASA